MKDKIIGVVIVITVVGLVVAGLVASNRANNSKQDNASSNLSSGSSDISEDGKSLLKKMALKDVTYEEGKMNIYIFWGEGCSFCLGLANFLASIEDEYGKYYNLVTFEVYGSEENRGLMGQVGDKLGEDPSGVPFLVIGNQSWAGYANSMDSDIKNSISEQFKKTDRFDVIKSLSTE